jgi:hypothetical protein
MEQSTSARAISCSLGVSLLVILLATGGMTCDRPLAQWHNEVHCVTGINIICRALAETRS